MPARTSKDEIHFQDLREKKKKKEVERGPKSKTN